MLPIKFLDKIVKGKILFNEPMSRHTSFRIGGEAEAFFLPQDENDLLTALSFLEKERIPYYLLGNGTNILVSDKGLKGVVIKLGNQLKGFNPSVRSAKSGTSLPRLLSTLSRLGLSGLEKLAGIPGTVGGAIKMNAGIPYFSIGDAVKSVKVFRNGETLWIPKEEITFSYRDSSLKGFVILEAIFQLTEDTPANIKKCQAKILNQRKLLQPLRTYNAGCVFRNPPSMSAGELLDKAGAKGMRQGGAYVSYKHANFIINRGDATAQDVFSLIQKCKELVKEKFNIELQLEIELWGEF
ncbi:UDP-N-acetylmuramate dehydrogenase [bacterium]|nr:UDP-N-acetylmuramate dehydrogenase [bacterium]